LENCGDASNSGIETGGASNGADTPDSTEFISTKLPRESETATQELDAGIGGASNLSNPASPVIATIGAANGSVTRPDGPAESSLPFNTDNDNQATTTPNRLPPGAGMPPADPAAAAPQATGLVATAPTRDRINLQWNLSRPAAQIVIERAQVGGDFAPVASVVGTVTNFVDKNLTEGTTYSYRVVAQAAAGPNAAASGVASATAAPAAPVSLAESTDSPTQVALSWTNRSHRADGVVVEASSDNWATFSTLATLAPMDQAYVAGGLKPDHTYHFRVRAFASARHALGADAAAVYSDYSNNASQLAASAPVTDLAATAPSAHEVLLTWSNHSTSQ
jgi:hypothetical protein